MLTFLKAATSYQIEIPLEDMRLLLVTESALVADDTFHPLYEKLRKLDGVSKIDYDGHYGANIFLMIDTVEDTPKTRQLISDTITQHLELCRA